MSSSNPVATNHKELIAWQLCAHLRRLILGYTRRPLIREDRRFVTQIRGAIRSACYLTSEGFYRKRDGDFINYLVMARASIGETSDQIDDGADSSYFNEAERMEMISLIKRAMAANSGLRRYLESEQNKKSSRRKASKRRRIHGPKDPRT